MSVTHKDSLSETAFAHAPLREEESITAVTHRVIPPWWGRTTTAFFTFAATVTDNQGNQGPVKENPQERTFTSSHA